MANERIVEIIKFAEGLKKDPNGKDILEKAIENVRKIEVERASVRRTLELLEEIKKVINLIPPKGMEKNN
jgi:Fe2+ or Zn2+ uptake regulation protein